MKSKANGVAVAKASPLVGDLARHLRARILAGEFHAEDRVSESWVASEYGVARPTAKAALDLLVVDGLLLRSPFAALRVPTIPAPEISEILRLLEFTEDLALERLLRETPDLRELRAERSASLHLFLDLLVQLSGSERLWRTHRSATFELLLGSLQNRLDASPLERAEVSEGQSHLAGALFEGDAIMAPLHLAALQRGRRAVLGHLSAMSR